MTVQIEEGKFYQTRNGAKVGPATHRGTSIYPWLVPEDDGTLRSYCADGRYDTVATASRWDIIQEWRTEGATPVVEDLQSTEADLINHPPHYTGHPSGVECIAITEHMNFCRGNAMKYLWRAGEKGDEVEDLKKARWYIDREISRLSA